MRVVITDAAKTDLINIGEFIRPDNPVRAVTFVDGLLDRCAGLADMAHIYPLVPRFKHHGIRRCVHRDCLIFYRVVEDLIEIIHIIHSARSYDTLLFPDGQTKD